MREKDGLPPATAQVAEDGLGLRVLARRASGLSVAALVSSGLSLPATFLAARWLGPDQFGRAQYVLLFYVYGSLFRSGVFEGGIRAFIHLRGRGETEEAVRSQNVGLSYELVVSLVPGLVLVAVAMYSDDPVQRLGFFVAPAAVIASSGASFLAGIYMARQQFRVVTQVTFVRAVFFPIALLAGVQLLGASGAVLAPVLLDFLVVVIYGVRASGFGIRLSFDRGRGRSLTRAGFPLGAAAMVYWAYRTVGTTSVAVALPAGALGVYAFAAAPMALLVRALSSVQAVLAPALWGEMATEKRTDWVDNAARIAVVSALVAAVATNLAQAGFGPLVSAYLPRFSAAIGLFELLVLNVLLLSLGAVPSLVLDAAAINRQTRHLAIWMAGLAVNVAANVTVLWYGLGAYAVAWNDLWVQGVVVLAVHGAAARYLPGDRWRSSRLRLLVICAVTGAIAVALHAGPQSGHGLAATSGLMIVRAAMVAGVWALVVVTFSWFAADGGLRAADAEVTGRKA